MGDGALGKLPRPQGIDGLRGRPPILVAVTAGRKKPGGGVIEKDRFHIVQRRENAEGVKPHHPEFRAFNEIPVDSGGRPLPGELEKRRVLRGYLVHATRKQCFDESLKAPILIKQHPNRLPACVGDGKTAVRWMAPFRNPPTSDPDDWEEIVCPGRQCEYQQPRKIRGRDVILCKPWVQLIFQLRWKDGVNLPTPLALYTSKGWNTAGNLYGEAPDGTPEGFLGEIELAARELGMRQYSLFGYPFMMSLREQTKPSVQARFAVVDFAPEMNPVEFFAAQARLREQIGAMPEPIALLEERTPDSEWEDEASISVPGNFDTGDE